MKILCTICARSGSKGVKNKNLRLLDGKPLVVHAINQANKLQFFEDIVISTDSTRIEKISMKYGAKTIGKRIKKLSLDDSSKIDVIRNALNLAELKFNKEYDLIIDIDVSSPLRKIDDIKKAFMIFYKNNPDNLITVCEARKNPYFNMIEYSNNGLIRQVKKNKNVFNSRQKAPIVYEMNASFYIWKKKVLFSKNPLFRKKTFLYKMPYNRSIDIDSEDDFNYVKYLFNKNEK